MTIGDILKAKREKLGLTMRDVMYDTGITAICHYENGRSDPSFTTAVKLAKYLDIDIRKLAKLV